MEIYVEYTERPLEDEGVYRLDFLRLTIRLLNLKRPQLNRVVQVLTGHCNLQRRKKTAGRAESSLSPKCSLEDEHQIIIGGQVNAKR